MALDGFQWADDQRFRSSKLQWQGALPRDLSTPQLNFCEHRLSFGHEEHIVVGDDHEQSVGLPNMNLSE